MKTIKNDNSVEEFLNTVENNQRRTDSFKVLEMMQEVTGEEPKMWGPSIVGFGEYHYRYASGHEGDAPLVAFSPRKQSLTLYVMDCDTDEEDPVFQNLLQQLGKHKTSKACLYINKLSDVDQTVLSKLILNAYEGAKKLYPKE
jgi:hypothetical protein